MKGEPRFYRYNQLAEGLVSFNVVYKETDLWIAARKNFSGEVFELVKKLRQELDDFIATFPAFLHSLTPLEELPPQAPPLARKMSSVAAKVGVGPMAAVAGAFAEAVGREILKKSPEVIVENGGDIFISTKKERTVAVYAGDSPLSQKLGVKIKPSQSPLGVCTSSGTVGHSLSFGKADAVMVLSPDTLLADAAATALGNKVVKEEDVEEAIRIGSEISGVIGLLIIKGEKLGVWGEMELVPL